MPSRSFVKESAVSKVTCNEIVLELVGNDNKLAENWWYGFNKAFEGRRPIDVPTQEVYDYLVQFL